MAKNYKWRTAFTYQNALDPSNHLSYGVIPSTYDTWQTAVAGEAGSNDATYFYRDSNTAYLGEYVDSISSRVAFSVTQTWTTSVDAQNNLTVSVTTTVSSVVRDDIRGADTNTPGRNISVYKEVGGTAYISVTDNQVATAHTISGAVSLGTYTFTLAPGQELTRNTLYIHNQTVGSGDYDDIWAGVQFMNPLPKDYRPGATLDTDTSIWKSNNITNGACHVLADVDLVTWQECRTSDGDIGGQGNPPLILHAADDNSWYNQKKIGKTS